MRYSADPDDPGFANFEFALKRGEYVHVTLDGVDQDHVRTADDDEGFIVRLVLDADGNFQIDPLLRDRVWAETVHGVVRIEARKPS